MQTRTASRTQGPLLLNQKAPAPNLKGIEILFR